MDRDDQLIFAALDLGTNNCRMLVARPKGCRFLVVDAFSSITRLGEGLPKTNCLSDVAMKRTILALNTCLDKMVHNRVTHMRLVATEACRRALNAQEFKEKVRKETGLILDIISVEEEANLALIGCSQLMDGPQSRSLVFDIGGGSTEIIWGKRETSAHSMVIEDVLSIPLGVMTLADQVGSALNDPDGYAQIVESLVNHFISFDKKHNICQYLNLNDVQVVGTSGTVTTLAALHLGLRKYDRSKVDGQSLPHQVIQTMIETVRAMSIKERTSHACIGSDRADLVVAGCAILDAICRTWHYLSLRVADRGVREGILLDLIHHAQNTGSQSNNGENRTNSGKGGGNGEKDWKVRIGFT